MDIEKLAVDANEEVGNEIISGVLEENTTEGINPKGFLLDESDVLLFQKELNDKGESNNTSVLAENKNLLSEELKKTLNGNKHDLLINIQNEKKIAQGSPNNQEGPSNVFFKSKEQFIENSVNKENSLIEKAFNPTTISETKKSNDYPSENSVDNIDKNIFVPREHSETKKSSDAPQVHSSENSVDGMVIPGQPLAIDHQDKSLNQTNKSENIANNVAYEIKAMPIEITMDPSKVIAGEAVNIQTPSTVENVVRTHSEIISQQIKDQIIDRILVSTNDLELNKTVKIVISPSLLESTQVNFQKIGQTLSIQFETINANSLQFLKANQVDLQLYLQENLKQFQDVSVRVKGSSQGFEQPQDGRSRNRYEYENLDDEEQ